MELRLYLPKDSNDWSAGEVHVSVRTESDIRTAGFAAARAVREWLRHMPFVPSQSDLRWEISAEVVPEAKQKPAPAPARAAHSDARRATVATQREVPPAVRSSGRAKRKSKRGK